MADQVTPPVFSENGDRQMGGFFPGIFNNSNVDNKFICKNCHRILRDPVQSPCGHRFCRSCRDEILGSNAEVDCPYCLEEEVEDHEIGKLSMNGMFPDNAVKREMSNMMVKCIFPGCSWRGRFKEYEAHERNCEFKQVACPLCAQAVTDGHMEEHRQTACPERTVKCEHCDAEVRSSRLQAHYETCENFPLTCELCGKANIARHLMKEHCDKNCQKRQMSCPVGCRDKFPLDEFGNHLRKMLEPHLAWTISTLVALEQKVEATIGSGGIVAPPGLNQMNEAIKRIEKKVENFERQILQTMQNKTSNSSEPSGSSSQKSDTSVSAEVAAKASLKMIEPVLGVIHNELDRALHTLGQLEGHFRQQQAQLGEIENQLRIQQQQLQLKDAALADLEMRLAAQEMARYDGTILWKVSGFESKKREAQNGQTTSLYSPAFYSGQCGYKMCARIYPNGDGIGKNTHISLFFVIMRGHYDALLPWPFTQKVTLMMIDQNHKEHVVDAFKPEATSSSFKRPTTEMNIASGCPLFLPLEKLNSRQYGYLRDDTIFVKILVETEGLDRYTEMNPGRISTGYS